MPSCRCADPRANAAFPFKEFHRLPGEHPEHDTTLATDELIYAVDLPDIAWAKNSHYLKVRDRASYAFALVSVATALEVDGRQDQNRAGGPRRGCSQTLARGSGGGKTRRRKGGRSDVQSRRRSRVETRQGVQIQFTLKSNWPSAVHRPNALHNVSGGLQAA